MGEAEEPLDPTVERLALEMKAVGLLYASDPELRSVLATGVLDSHDEQVRRVVTSLRLGRKGGLSSIIVALGELVLTSFLMVAGAATLGGLFLGGSYPESIVRYFTSSPGEAVQFGPIFQSLPVLEILLAALLLASALYLLRRASTTLKEAGLTRSG